MSHRRPRRGFTLVEMLVVIGIVAVLAALLLPAVMMAVNRARHAAIVYEITEISKGVDSYRLDKGDYPPNFRDFDAFMRHVRKCYPKITPTNLNTFIIAVWGTNPPAAGVTPTIDEGESLLFWLASIHDNQLDPFGVTPAGAGSPFKKFYEFDEKRYANEDNDGFPSFLAKNSRDTCYIYMDSRSYLELSQFSGGTYSDTANSYAFAEDYNIRERNVRPYWSESAANSTATGKRNQFKPMNATSFQIVCAGLDGDFGFQNADAEVKFFPSGGNYDLEGGDDDNVTNFSEGARLADKIP